MLNPETCRRSSRSNAPKPYAMLGAGPLVSTLWKGGSEVSGWRYRFNLFRLADSGAVGHKFTPADLKHLVKLTQVLAAVLADDGCVSAEEREELLHLAQSLDDITSSEEPLE